MGPQRTQLLAPLSKGSKSKRVAVFWVFCAWSISGPDMAVPRLRDLGFDPRPTHKHETSQTCPVGPPEQRTDFGVLVCRVKGEISLVTGANRHRRGLGARTGVRALRNNRYELTADAALRTAVRVAGHR